MRRTVLAGVMIVCAVGCAMRTSPPDIPAEVRAAAQGVDQAFLGAAADPVGFRRQAGPLLTDLRTLMQTWAFEVEGSEKRARARGLALEVGRVESAVLSLAANPDPSAVERIVQDWRGLRERLGL